MGLEREVSGLSKLLLLTLSTPIKPGALHRLRLDHTFEESMIESIHIIAYAQEAYQRGAELRRGSRSISTLQFGKVVYNSLLKAFEDLERRPLLGLHAAVLTSALILGYTYGEDASLYERLSKGVKTILYRTGTEDVEAILDGMEAASLGDELSFLDSLGVNRRSIIIHGASLGDLYEALYKIDTGFMLNLVGLREVKQLKGRVSGKRYPEWIISAYLALAESRGLIRLDRARPMDLRQLAKIDKELSREAGKYNKLLGGTLLLVLISKGLL